MVWAKALYFYWLAHHHVKTWGNCFTLFSHTLWSLGLLL